MNASTSSNHINPGHRTIPPRTANPAHEGAEPNSNSFLRPDADWAIDQADKFSVVNAELRLIGSQPETPARE